MFGWERIELSLRSDVSSCNHCLKESSLQQLDRGLLSKLPEDAEDEWLGGSPQASAPGQALRGHHSRHKGSQQDYQPAAEAAPAMPPLQHQQDVNASPETSPFLKKFLTRAKNPIFTTFPP
eukprot:CAMPEP_0206538848 /NCGR_PEP_ID=MMETSP0325_2-20121206/8109_1 /ASSEMBLY_ACC=CAM_ASM_000347 /TAXON_ID=2866 /ORGANISM="Crypthecodinium cohnii, Strain Seligo" /LENGTH=120 /DNA_ID=CAMNT_0054036369 /DNA_START=102 /DNA_END=462 /DNA_ORIENTATION=+